MSATDAERLKVAEEIINELLPHGAARQICGVFVSRAQKQKEMCFVYRIGGPTPLVEDKSPIDAIILARQKLAAEREAAMTPNERKYKAALEEICDRVYLPAQVAYDIARKALEES